MYVESSELIVLGYNLITKYIVGGRKMSKRLLVLLLSGGLLLTACGGDSSGEKKDESKDTSDKTEEVKKEDKKEEKKEEKGPLSIGDSKTIDDITLTVKNSYYTDERNEFDDTNPEKVIAIEYTIENNAEDDYPYGMDMQAYVDGKKTESYPLGMDMGSVSSGRSVDSVAYFGVNGEKVEIEWEPMFSMSGDKGIWDVTPQ